MIELTAAPATLPPGQRIYAIGDIHGCLDRLVALHEMIAEDLADRPVGAHHPGASRRLCRSRHGQCPGGRLAAQPAAGSRGCCRQPDGQPRAHDAGRHRPGGQGGRRAMAAQRRRGLADELGRARGPCRQQDWAAPHPAAASGVPARPGAAATGSAPTCSSMPASARACRCTSRRGRTCCGSASRSCPRSDHGAVVVHGHTPKREPCRHNRIGIDTGAVIGGALTCVVLEEDTLGFFHTVKHSHCDRRVLPGRTRTWLHLARPLRQVE